MEGVGERIRESRRRTAAGMDVPWLLGEWARRAPDKPFLIWEPFEGNGRTWTFSELRRDARRLAAGLHARGIRAGDFVILHLDNSPEFVLAWFACAELGAVAVSTNTRCVARDLEYFAAHTDAVCVLTQPAYAAMIRGACRAIRFLAVTDTDAGAPAAADPAWDAVPFGELFAADDEALPDRPVDAQANLSVQFTSGTTSRPKAVLWTHANGVWAARAGANHLRLRHEDRTLVFMPLFHTNAQGWSMLPMLWVGGTLVVQPRFSSSRFWEISLRHELTWLSTIPFAFKAIADQPVPAHQYRFWGTGAHLPELGETFGVDVIGWWGMTETITQGIITDLDHRGPRGTMGRAAPEYEIEIRRTDGTLAGPDERGHLWIRGVRGVSLFKEYYRNDEANEKAFDEHGFFDTGDVVRADAEGWLYFSDRDKDMLKVGAENVAASEIESVVLLTGLADECAVVGRRHPMLDEVPVAFVIPREDAGADAPERILAFCRENLADFKVPREVILVESLPRSTLEKVAKAELRARVEAADGDP